MVKEAYQLLEKKEDYLFKVEILDVKTEKLFSIIKTVTKVIEYQKCKEDIHSIFFSLAHFSDHYLRDLEIFLRDVRCKTLVEQRIHNSLFIDNIIEFKDAYTEGREMLCNNLLSFIIEWTEKQKKIDELSCLSLEKVKF